MAWRAGRFLILALALTLGACGATPDISSGGRGVGMLNTSAVNKNISANSFSSGGLGVVLVLLASRQNTIH